MLHDLRYGMRTLRKNPTFALVAILALALGTGANAAIFQLVNALRLRSLPVEKPNELVSIGLDQHGTGRAAHGWWVAPSGRGLRVFGRAMVGAIESFQVLGVAPRACLGVDVRGSLDLVLAHRAVAPLRRPRAGSGLRAVWWLDIMGRLK